MSVVAAETRALRHAAIVAPALVVAVSTGFLFARTVPDVGGKPWQEDEAVAGLISAQPLGDALHTAVVERGGAPLHFTLAHAALAVDSSSQTLRWLSFVFALATIPLCYDLARRGAGQFAGATAAALAATSQLLAVYATFGRMYALFGLASTLALDLFVRAVRAPTPRTLAAAVVATLLLLAAHPFGLFVFLAELAVAAWLWRLRALPFALLAVPFGLAYLRLGGRYSPDVGMSAPEAAVRAAGGSAGGYGIGLLLVAAVAAVGAWTLPRSHAAFALALPIVPAAVLTVISNDKLSPRHLIFVLPVWTTLVGAAGARLPGRVLVAAALVAVAALAPAAIADPRAGVVGDTDAPAAWLREHVRTGDVLYPYSPVFLAALPQAAVARGLPREPVSFARAAKRLGTVRRIIVAVPLRRPLRRSIPRGHLFASWLLLEHRGPLSTLPADLARVVPLVRGNARAAVLQLYATSTDGTSAQRSSRR